MDASAVRTVILWTHAAGGAAWIGACAAFLLAGGAMGTDTEEGHRFARRAGPSINRIGLGAMLLIVLSGMVNFVLAGSERNYHFSSAFIAILFTKIALLVAMFLLLILSFRAELDFESADSSAVSRAMRRTMLCGGAIAGCGAVAIVLGLWLLGS